MPVIASLLTSTLAGLGQLILWGIVSAINLLIAAVGALLQTILGLLSFMPDPPETPAWEWLAWLNWVFPLGDVLGVATGLLGLWTAFLLIRVALNWVKAL